MTPSASSTLRSVTPSVSTRVKGVYEGLIYAKTAPEFLSPGTACSFAPTSLNSSWPQRRHRLRSAGGGGTVPSPTTPGPNVTAPAPQPPSKPRRFYGSVEIDMNRPVKAFDTILNSVVMELQRSPGAKVKLTLEIEAEAPSGFNDADVGVVRDNTKQLKFTPGSTGFSD